MYVSFHCLDGDLICVNMGERTHKLEYKKMIVINLDGDFGIQNVVHIFSLLSRGQKKREETGNAQRPRPRGPKRRRSLEN